MWSSCIAAGWESVSGARSFQRWRSRRGIDSAALSSPSSFVTHTCLSSPPLGPAALAFLPCHICHRRSVARVALGFKFNLVSIWCNCFERQPRRRVFSPVFCDPESPGPCRRPSHRCSSAIHKTSGFIPPKGHLNGATSYLHAGRPRGSFLKSVKVVQTVGLSRFYSFYQQSELRWRAAQVENR